MSYDIAVLKAVMGVTKAGRDANTLELRAELGGTDDSVRAAFRRLEKAGLLARIDQDQGRLTLAGLALAAALEPVGRLPSRAPRPRPAWSVAAKRAPKAA
jgi:Mn-dependent DtxR family transcriptional regulator